MSSEKKFNFGGVKSFYFRIGVYKTNRDFKPIEVMSWENLRMDTRLKWQWYFDYRAALLKVKYPRYDIRKSWGAEDAIDLTKEQIEAKLLKKEITNTKRMVTKIGNVILKYESYQRTKLLPDWENVRYLRTKEKLIEYENKLKKLLNESNI